MRESLDLHISMPIEALRCQPSMKWNHVDGPLMNWGGRLHWLTWRERLSLWFGWTTLRDIAVQQWPEARFWIPLSPTDTARETEETPHA